MIEPIKEASGIAVYCAYVRLCDVVELIPNPKNPNTHSDEQIALLAKIIRHQGWRAPIVVSKRSGFIVAGHGRLQAAQVLQVEKVPVDFQDFATEADEWAHLIADNRIAELAEINELDLSNLLKELDGKIDLDLTGFTVDALSERSEEESDTVSAGTLQERFGVPPFSVLDARQGYWQERKRAWLSLGIQSELGRGGHPEEVQGQPATIQPASVATEQVNR
jgi:hypothetical protein